MQGKLQIYLAKYAKHLFHLSARYGNLIFILESYANKRGMGIIMPDGIDGDSKHTRIMQAIKKHPSQNGIFICILSYRNIIVGLILSSNHQYCIKCVCGLLYFHFFYLK